MELSVTLIIIIITCLVSVGGFYNQRIINDLIFYPPAVSENNHWYRFISCGLIHADFGHLAFNMYALYIFGVHVETGFGFIFGSAGKTIYVIMYISALVACLLPTYSKHKNDYYYRSLGASGAVSAVIFSFILLFPLQKMGLIFIPVMIPGFIFGLLYLGVSTFLEKKAADNVNHSAHIWGAFYGIGFLIAMGYAMSDYPVLSRFIEQVKTYLTGF
ncbi:MAG TPA: rhomboid family intramembrane serine protease [Chitinophagaceae bacterium]|nr:rhomboid family intramembrane serine protease [Chitinophagaceae bacterium]